MEQEKITKFLKKLELSEKEIHVYLYILSNGPRIVTKISKDCSLTRTHTYDIIKKLEEKGFCHFIGSGYGRKVSVLNPSNIKNILKSKKNKIEDLELDFEIVSPILNSFSSFASVKNTEVFYFNGAENIEKMLSMSLINENKEIFFAGSELDLIDSIGLTNVVKYNINRSKIGIILKSLRPGNKRGDHYTLKEDKKYLREIRIRPDEVIKLNSNIIIWDNYVAFISLKDNNKATLIYDETLSSMLKTWFEFIWVKSKKVK
jgi:sugar-specific transcriptional regulator TrmB